MEIATLVLRNEFNLQDNLLSLYSKIPVYYDVTNPSKPLWRFIFSWGAIERDKIESSSKDNISGFCFRVEIDAMEGNNVSTEKFEFTRQMDNLGSVYTRNMI